jgi:drug/metabolite transporter (DMT)-like permease
VPQQADQAPARQSEGARPHTFTGLIGAICLFPLRAIIRLCVALRIHPNTLTLVGVIVTLGAAWALGSGRFVLGGVIMILAAIFIRHERVTPLRWSGVILIMLGASLVGWSEKHKDAASTKSITGNTSEPGK